MAFLDRKKKETIQQNQGSGNTASSSSKPQKSAGGFARFVIERSQQEAAQDYQRYGEQAQARRAAINGAIRYAQENRGKAVNKALVQREFKPPVGRRGLYSAPLMELAEDAVARQKKADGLKRAMHRVEKYGLGNIDLTHRPQYKYPDGSVATVESMSFGTDEGEILVPTIDFDKNGNPVKLSDDAAIQRYYDTGEYLGKFKTVDEANKYADWLHNQQENYYVGRPARELRNKLKKFEGQQIGNAGAWADPKNPTYLDEVPEQYLSPQAKQQIRERNAAEMARHTAPAEQFAAEHPIIGAANAVAGDFVGSAGALVNIADMALHGQPIDPNDPGFTASRVADASKQGTKTGIKNDLNIQDYDENGNRTFASRAVDFGVDTGISIVETLLRSAMGAGVTGLAIDAGALGGSMTAQEAAKAAARIGGRIGAGQSSVSAGTSAFLDAKDRGADDGQAIAYGIANGFAEYFFEKYSIESFLTERPVDSIKAFLRETTRQMAVEGQEELATEIANTVSDQLIMGELSNINTSIDRYVASGMSPEEAKRKANWDAVVNILMAGVGGAVSGGILGGGKSAFTYRGNTQTGRQMLQNNQGFTADELTETANAMDVNPESYRDRAGDIDEDALSQATNTQRYLQQLAEQAADRELTAQETGAAVNEIGRTAAMAKDLSGFTEDAAEDDALMRLAEESVVREEEQKRAQYNQIAEAARTNPDTLRQVTDGATMLSEAEKTDAILAGQQAANDDAMADLTKEISNGGQESRDNVYSAGSERLLGDSSGKPAEGSRGIQRTLGESWQTKATAFRDNEAKTLRIKEAQSAERVLKYASPEQTVYSVEGDTKETSNAKAIASAIGVKNHILYASEDGGIYVGGGRLSLVRGSYDFASDTITACVNNPNATSRQITSHETVHRAIARGNISANGILSSVKKANEDRWYDIDTLASIYMDWSNGDYDSELAMEELLCDIGGGINQFEKYADQGDEEAAEYAAVMRGVIEEVRPMLNDALDGALDATGEQGNTEISAREEKATGDVEAVSKSTDNRGIQYSTEQFANSLGFEIQYDEDGATWKIVDPETKKPIKHITPDQVKQTSMGCLIQAAVESGTVSEDIAKKQRKMFADLMNLTLKYDPASLPMVWEVSGSFLFSSVKTNSDAQYSTTVDYGTICSKTQALIDVLSNTMVEKGRGLTREEVITAYNKTANQGLSVPCPVCYVFSRWMGVPSLLDNMRRCQERFGNASESYVQRYIKDMLSRYGDAKAINSRKTSVQNRMAALEQKLQKANAENDLETKKAIRKETTELQRELDDLESFNWVTQVRCNSDGKGGYKLDPKYKSVPNEVLLDLRRSGDFASKYPKSWKYRTTRGAGMGKAIMPYSGATIGDFVKGNKDRWTASKNPFTLQNLKNAKAAIKRAITRAAAQNLIGGQRFQSTSDYRAEWGIDYLMTFLECQAAGSQVQLYTKVIEAVDMLASAGAECNLSIMPKDNGYIIKNRKKQLVFSDVTGINFDEALKKVRKYDNVQMILVGINDEHIKLALADDRITFVIPWHSSGNSKDTLAQLMSAVGETLDVSQNTDYSDSQTDKVIDNSAHMQRLRQFRKEILQGKLWENYGKRQAKTLTNEQRTLLNENAYLNDLYNRFYKDTSAQEYGVRLNGKQTSSIFPYEYWDKSLTYKDADQNGRRFQEYCASLGIQPRFIKFANEHGYWKLLIDRKMYNNDGTYHTPKAIDVTNVKVSQLPLAVNSNNYKDMNKIDQATMDTLRALDGVKDDLSAVDNGDSEIEELSSETENTAQVKEVTDDSVDAMMENGYTRKEAAEAVETGGVVHYSTRLEPPPKKTITAYKAFYAMDGKLYPPMVANDVETEQNKGKKKVSGTLKGLETPVGVWIDADVGRLAYGEDGKPLRNTKGRLAVKNDKGGGTLAFRPGWHLGLWPDAKQFNVKDPITGELKACMPDGLVFARCSVAADYDYQLEALGYGMKDNGKFDRTQAGLPRIPKNGYYMYRTNVDPTTAPWIITGAIKVEEILDDDMSAEICKRYGITADPRASHKKINLADYGLKAGPVTPTEDMDRFLPNDAVKANAAALEEALADKEFANAYVARSVNFDDPEIVKELARNKQNAAFYKEAQAKYGNKSYAVNNPNDPLIDKNTFAYSSQLVPNEAELDDTFPDWREAFSAPGDDVYDITNSQSELIAAMKDNNQTVGAMASALGQVIGKSNNVDIAKESQTIAARIARRYGSKVDTAKLTGDIEQLLTGLQESTKRNVDEVEAAASNIGAEVLNGITQRDPYMDQNYKNLRKELRSYKLTLSEADRADIASAYDTYNNFRKKVFGRLTLVNNDTKGAIPVDTAYQELSEKYPDLFPEDITHPAEQLIQMAEVARSFNAAKVSAVEGMDEYDYEMQSYMVGQDILKEYYSAAGETKFKAEYDAQIEALKNKYEQRIKNLRNQKNARIEQIKQGYRDRVEKARLKKLDSRARTYLLEKAKKLAKMKGGPEFEAAKQELIGNLDLVAKGMRSDTKAKLEEFKKRAEALAEQDENYEKLYFKSAREVFSRLEKTHINDMTGQEVEELTTKVLELIYQEQTTKQMLNESQGKMAATVARRAMSQQENVKGIDDRNIIRSYFGRWKLNMLNPTRAFQRIDGYQNNGVFTELGRQLNDGQTKMNTFVMNASKKFNGFLEDHPDLVKTWSKADIDTGFKDKSGRPVLISKGMRISLYLHSLNSEQNGRHIAEGGIKIPNAELYNRGLYRAAYRYGQELKLKPTDLAAITSQMTADERAFADLAHDFLNVDTKNAINETSLVLNGTMKAMVDNYFPIRSNPNFTMRDITGLVMDGTIEGMGMLKERVSGAMNQILLEDVAQVLQRQTNNTALYYGLAIPVRDFNKVMTFKEAGANESVRDSIEKAWGDAGLDYITDVLNQIQGGTPAENGPGARLFNSLKSTYAGTVLNWNLGVAIKQSASAPFAAVVLDAKSVARAIATNTFSKADYDYMDSITPWSYMRRQGMSGTEMGEVYKQKNAVQQNRAFQKFKEKTNFIQNVDVWTTDRLFFATEYYVQDHYPELKVRGTEYNKKVAEIYNDMLQRTQPSYDVMQRNAYLRSGNFLSKVFGMFKTQTFNMGGEIIDAAGRVRAYEQLRKDGRISENQLREAKAQFGKTVTATAVSQMMLAVLGIVAKAIMHNMKGYRDDNGEVTPESIAARGMYEFLTSFAGMGMGGNELQSYLLSLSGKEKWYDIAYPGLSVANELASSSVDMSDAFRKAMENGWDEKSVANLKKKIGQFTMNAAIVGRIPAGNLYNIANAMNLWYQDYKNGMLGTFDAGEGIWGIKNSSVTGPEYAKQALYEFEHGNERRAKYALGNTKKEQLETALGAEGEKDENGDTISGSKQLDAISKINDLDMGDEYKVDVIQAMYPKLDTLKPDLIDEYIDIREVKSGGKQEDVANYLKKVKLSKESKIILWELAGYAVDAKKDGKTVKNGNFDKWMK